MFLFVFLHVFSYSYRLQVVFVCVCLQGADAEGATPRDVGSVKDRAAT